LPQTDGETDIPTTGKFLNLMSIESDGFLIIVTSRTVARLFETLGPDREKSEKHILIDVSLPNN